MVNSTETMQPHTPAFSPLQHDGDALLPAAAYLGQNPRRDGWTAGRKAAFLCHLADTGVVADAARAVGMSLPGAYALRRKASGYAFNLGWEAALLIARRIVADQLMTAAIKGEEARWVREDGVTTYTRRSAKLAMTLLDRVTPIESLSEVLAVVTRFDWFVQLIDDGVSAAELWQLCFDSALPRHDIEARDRVMVGLLLADDSADFEADKDGWEAQTTVEADEGGAMEYKSLGGADAARVNHSISTRAAATRGAQRQVALNGVLNAALNLGETRGEAKRWRQRRAAIPALPQQRRAVLDLSEAVRPGTFSHRFPLYRYGMVG